MENPPEAGTLRIFNQFVETFSITELAERVRHAGESMGLRVRTQSIRNPRQEQETHYYNPRHTGLFELGLKPTHLSNETLRAMIGLVQRHREAIAPDRILRDIRWR